MSDGFLNNHRLGQHEHEPRRQRQRRPWQDGRRHLEKQNDYDEMIYDYDEIYDHVFFFFHQQEKRLRMQMHENDEND
jgi:hypothetical protein